MTQALNGDGLFWEFVYQAVVIGLGVAATAAIWAQIVAL
jgi:hypothetical protein